MSGLRASLQTLTRTVIAYRLVLSVGAAASASIMLHALWPWPASVPLVHYFALERPRLYMVVAHGYDTVSVLLHALLAPICPFVPA